MEFDGACDARTAFPNAGSHQNAGRNPLPNFTKSASDIRAASVGAFILLTTPVAAHVIARASSLADVPLWDGTVLDERRRDSDRVAQHDPVAGE